MQAEDSQRQVESLRAEVREQVSAAVALQHRASARDAAASQLEDEVTRLTAERSDFDERIGELQAMLTANREQRAESGKGQAAVQARLQEALAENARLAARLSALDEDRSAMQTQLREVRYHRWPPCSILHPRCPCWPCWDLRW